jgi:Icc-related predicted phosphoesterase/uncharacterized protein YprB with RNaseH-like and TPR domain
VAFSDYRVQDVFSLYEFLRKLDPKPDIVIYAGDDVARFKDEDEFYEIDWFEELAKCSNYKAFVILGNDDSYEDKSILKAEYVYDLHDDPVIADEYVFIGQEGGLKEFPIGHILYSEKEIKKHLNSSINKIKEDLKSKKFKNKKIILVSHNPPFGTLDYAIRFEGRHIGSKSIRDFIQRENVILNICGHVHSRGGQKETMGNITIVNVASHDQLGSPGRIAVIDLRGGEIEKIEFKEIWDSVFMSINGIGGYYADILEKYGIETIKDLAEQVPKELNERTGIGYKRAENWILAAKSVINNEPYSFRPFKFDENGIAYIDIELGGGIGIFLIGLYDSSESSTRQFVAHKATKKEAKRILEEFLNFLKEKNYKQLYCFGGLRNFDFNCLREETEKLKFNKEKYRFAIQQIKKGKNIYPEFHRSLVIPSKSFGIKEVASSLGFKFRQPDINWLNIGDWYRNYLEKKDKNILQKILEYNEDDVLAIHYVVGKLKKMNLPKI